MREQIDQGLRDRGLEAVVVCGGPSVSWETAYLVGPVKVTWGYVFKRVGQEPVFMARSIERHEAAKARCPLITFDKVGISEIGRADLPRAEREAAIVEQILEFNDCRGKVALYGSGSISTYGECLRILRERQPDTFPHAQGRRSLFEEATLTKDEDEIERIADVGLRVEDVIRTTFNYLTTLIGEGDTVFDFEGEAITVGDIKDMIVREAGRRKIDVPIDVTFAQGPLSAIPNNRGESREALRTGTPVVFDIAAQARRGYHFELTRTFCIGETTPRFEEVFGLVNRALEISLENLRPGRSALAVNAAVSDFFEQEGFPTLRQGKTERGFVHFLGHGIGLDLYEHPKIGPVEEELELQPGMVLAIEPGLYLPEESFGVRLGEVAVVEKSGPPRVLSRVDKKPLVRLSR